MIFAPYIGPTAAFVMLCTHVFHSAQIVVSQDGNNRLTSCLAMMNETSRGYSLIAVGPVECVQARSVRVISQQFLASARLSFDDKGKPIGGGASTTLNNSTCLHGSRGPRTPDPLL